MPARRLTGRRCTPASGTPMSMLPRWGRLVTVSGMSEWVRFLDYETTRWAGQTVGGFSQDDSIGSGATFTGYRAWRGPGSVPLARAGRAGLQAAPSALMSSPMTGNQINMKRYTFAPELAVVS